MSPQAFDPIEARTVRRQPEDFDFVSISLQPSRDWLGAMKAPVVVDEPDFAARVGSGPGDQESQKVEAAFGGRDRIGNFSGRLVNAAVDHLFFILSRRRNFGLSAGGFQLQTLTGTVRLSFATVLPA